jgi:methionine biosynthesis protein MetW
MAGIIDSLDPKNENVLDIGCYDGSFLSLLKNGNNNFFGVEASNWGFEKSREKNIDVQQYFFDDKSPLPYENNFFDIVIAGEIIEHIYDTDFFLDEIRRILKPGGKLLISTPNIASLARRLLLAAGKSPLIENSPNQLDSSGHIRYFTFAALQNLLRKHKLKIISRQSDCINFSKNGLLRSVFLAKLFPKLGASIIVLASKQQPQ